jgi:uncharacterized protein with HEPN domain
MIQVIAILILNLTLTLIVVTDPKTTQAKIKFVYLVNIIILLFAIFGWSKIVNLTNYLNNFQFQDKIIKETKRLGEEAKEISKENRRIIDKYKNN